MYVDPVHSPARFLLSLPRRLLLLLESQFGPITVDLVVLWPLVRCDRMARFLCFGTLVSLLPVCATIPMDRLLLLSGFGGFGLLGLFIAGLAKPAGWLAAARWQRFLVWGFALSLLLVHGPLAALLLRVRVWVPQRVNVALVKDLARGLPVGPGIAKQHLVCVATQGSCFFGMTMIERKQSGWPVPQAFTGLATGSTPIRITRIDERTLRLVPDGGFFPRQGMLEEEGVAPPPISSRYANQVFDSVFREPEAAWRVGDGRDRNGVAIRVTALTTDGRSAAIEARFVESLESPVYAWIVCTAGKFQAWTPPALGETTRTKDVEPPV
jgi:hypothetical protein